MSHSVLPFLPWCHLSSFHGSIHYPILLTEVSHDASPAPLPTIERESPDSVREESSQRNKETPSPQQFQTPSSSRDSESPTSTDKAISSCLDAYRSPFLFPSASQSASLALIYPRALPPTQLPFHDISKNNSFMSLDQRSSPGIFPSTTQTSLY